MSREELRVVAPDPKTDCEAIIDLFAKVFGGKTYFQRRDYGRQRYVAGSHYDWSASRVGFIGERMVTHWGVWDYRMRIGQAEVRVAGIGAVATHHDFRRRGLVTRTLTDSLEALPDEGYDLSLLFGIPNFYHRFGYARAWADHTYVVDRGELPTTRPDPRPRKLRKTHRNARIALYNRQFAGLTGTAVRPTYAEDVLTPRTEGLEWFDPDGSLAGWVTLRDGVCLDHAGRPEQVLAVLGDVARKRFWSEVRFQHLHHRSDLARTLRRTSCRLESRYHASAGAMVRTVNLESTLRRIAPELTRRLKASPLAGWSGELALTGPRGRCNLGIADGKVRVAPPRKSRHRIAAGDEMAQLLIGTEAPSEIAAACGTRLAGDAADLAEVLFPAQQPSLADPDCF